MRWLPAALLFLLAVPFEPLWLDYELARRGVAMLALAACGLLLALHGGTAAPRGGWVLGLLVLYALARTALGVTHPRLGLEEAAWLAALALTYVLGAATRPEDWLRAALPTAAVVALFGLLPLLPWTTWGLPHFAAEATSTLGNRNVASEVVAVLVVAAGAWALQARSPWAGLVVVGLASAYLLVNGSRSGLVAAPLGLGLVLLAASRRDAAARRRAVLVLVAAAAGVLASFAAALAQGGEAAGDPQARAERAARVATLEVRSEVWRATLGLAAERPLLGVGPGQFRSEFPRVRTEREIEISSFGRRFATRVETTHNDPLQLLAEGGAIGAVLWLWFLARAGPGVLRAGIARSAPLLAFVVLGLVRSPLWNAPAAVFAFGLLGSLQGGAAPAAKGAPAVRAIVGAAALFALAQGQAIVRSQHHAAAHVAVRARGGAERAHLDAALRARPGDTTLLLLRLQGLNDAGQATSQEAEADANSLAALDPHSPLARRRLAEWAAKRGRPGEAEAHLRAALAIDPRDPETRLALATLLVAQQRVDQALTLLCADLHPRLRGELARHLADLAGAAKDRGDVPGSARLVREALFVAALDEVQARPGSPGGNDAVRTCLQRFAGDGHRELGPMLLLARQAQALGDDRLVLDTARAAREGAVPLSAEHRALLSAPADDGPSLLDVLARHPAWSWLRER